MKKHREFWREVKKRGLALLLVCLLVAGIVMPTEYGYATNNVKESVAETELDMAESEVATEWIDSSEGVLEEEINETFEGIVSEEKGDIDFEMQPVKATFEQERASVDLTGYDWSKVDIESETDPIILDILDYMANIQTMIDALPDVACITKENSDSVSEVFETILDVIDRMEDEVGVSYYIVTSQNASLIRDAHLWEVEEKLSLVEEEFVLVVEEEDLPISYGVLPDINKSSAIELSSITLKAYKTEGFNIDKDIPGTEISDGIGQDSEFWLVLKLDNLLGITFDQTYKVPIEGIKSSQSISSELSDKIGENISDDEVVFGKMLIEEGESDLYVAFNIKDDPQITIGGVKKSAEQNDIKDIVLAFKCKIDDSKRPDTGSDLEIKLSGTTQKTIHVTDWEQPDESKDPTLSKTVSQTGNNATWTIVYAAPEDGKYAGNGTKKEVAEANIPDLLVDTLPTGLKLEGTPTVTYEDGTALDASHTVTFTQAGQKLQWEITPKKNITKPIKITYNTTLDNDTDADKIRNWASGTEKENNVMGVKTTLPGEPIQIDGHPLQDKKKITVSYKNEKPAPTNKTADSYDATNKTITWTVKVNTNIAGTNFTKFELKEKLGNGLEGITDIQLSPVGTPGAVTSSGQNYTVDLTDYVKAFSGPEEFTVTYKTNVKEDFYQGAYLLDDLKNEADVYWEVQNTSGIGTNPLAKTGSDVPAAKVVGPPGGISVPTYISKKAGTYEKETRRFTWKIGVGGSFAGDTFTPDESLKFKEKIVIEDYPFSNNISETTANAHMTFLDPLSSEDKETQEAALASIIKGAVESANPGIDSTKLNVAVSFSTQSAGYYNRMRAEITYSDTTYAINPFAFELKTYSTHVDLWVGYGGSGNNAHNKVELVGAADGTATKTSSGPLKGNQRARADISAPAFKSLEKKAVSYDHSTHTITWRLEVNNNNVPLGNVKVVDTLPVGISYISGTAKYQCNSESEQTFGSVGVQASNIIDFETGLYINPTDAKEMHFYLKDVKSSEKYVITFQTKLDVDDGLSGVYLTENSEDKLVFENKARLHVPAYNKSENWISPDPQADAKSKVEMPNNPLDKKMQQDTSNPQKVRYTVNVNPYSFNIFSTDATIWLEDIYEDGLVIDKSTLKLYSAVLKNPYGTISGNNIALSDQMDKVDPITLNPETDIVFEFDSPSPNNTMRVKIPDDHSPYILEYDAYIMKKNINLNNEINILSGSNSHTGNAIEKNVFAHFESHSRAALRLPPELQDQYVEVAILKVDESDDTILLQDVEFGLYEDIACTPGTEITKGKTDSQGTLTLTAHETKFSDSKIPDKVYIKEIGFPSGYKTNDIVYTVSVGSLLHTDDPDLTVKNIKNTTSTDGKIKLHKVDQDGENLSGAVFAIYTDNTKTVKIAEKTSDTEGHVVFENLERNTAYYVEEISAPVGYEKSTEVIPLITTSNDGTEVVYESDIVNEEVQIEVSILKVDKDDNTIILPGAEFGLYADEACAAGTEISKGTTDASGKLKLTAQSSDFSGKIIPDKIYIKEISFPSGYETNDTVYTVTVASLKNTGDPDLIVENVKIPTDGKIKLHKVDQDGENLSGAVFAIYTDNTKTVKIAEKTSDTEGHVVFENLERNTAYYVEEISAPVGYEKSTEVIPLITTSNDGTEVVYESDIVNKEIQIEVSILKVDKDDDTIILSGAEFGLYADEACAAGTEISKGTTDASGKLKLTAQSSDFSGKIIPDKIYIKEISFPSGYETNDTVYTVTVASLKNTGDPDLIVENVRKNPKPNPKPSKKKGGNTTDDSSTPETTAPPVKPTENKAVVQNGKIPQTGQLWWPVWFMGGLGSLFLVFGFLWKPKKKK